jgi:cyclic pyranopterin phosphate synthase
MSDLSHFDESGKIRMVDVSEKAATARTATASGRVLLNSQTIEAVRSKTNPKGEPLEIARIAGIIAAKKTSDLIPLCHQIALSGVDIKTELTDFGVSIEATAKTTAGTGVEMEALTAVTVAALTVYDMCKAVQKDIVISDIHLRSKSGGKTDYKA